MCLCKHIGLLLASLLFLAPVDAQPAISGSITEEPSDTLKSYAIEEVVVTGSNRYREVIPAQQLSGKKLDALSSFSVADAIRYF